MKSYYKTFSTTFLVLCILKGIISGMIVPGINQSKEVSIINDEKSSGWFIGLIDGAIEGKTETKNEKEGEKNSGKGFELKIRLGKLAGLCPAMLHHNSSVLISISHFNWIRDHYLSFRSQLSHYLWLRFHFLKIPCLS